MDLLGIATAACWEAVTDEMVEPETGLLLAIRDCRSSATEKQGCLLKNASSTPEQQLVFCLGLQC